MHDFQIVHNSATEWAHYFGWTNNVSNKIQILFLKGIKSL